MLFSPQPLTRRLADANAGFISARMVANSPQINLACAAHQQIAEYVCINESCAHKLLCSECIFHHDEPHKSNILPYEEVFGLDIIRKIDQEISINRSIEKRNEIYLKYFQQVQLALREIRRRVEKTLTSLLTNFKEKAYSHCVEPLHPTLEWDKLKKTILDRRLYLSKANPANYSKLLNEYIRSFSVATNVLVDVENARDLKDPINTKDLIAPEEIEPEEVDETIINLRRILDDFSSKISSKLSPTNTPEENMMKGMKRIVHQNNLALSTVSTIPKYPKPVHSNDSDLSPSLFPNKERSPDSTPLEAHRNFDLGKMKSLSAEECSFNKLPPFIYDEYLETEEVNLPYVGPIKLKDETIYKGQMKNNKRWGKGKQVWKDGRFFEGYFREDLIDGKGRIIHPDLDIYEGQWRNGKAEGFGTYTKVDGWVYKGQWSNDQPHGPGVETWPDGSIYEGEFRFGVKCGKGTLVGPDGSCYSGDFKDNLFEGQGKYIWIDGKKYEGSWVQNVRQGKGIMTWPDGKRYEGEFFEDKRHGFGKYEWGDGRQYIGYWKDGKQNGHGKLVDKNGKTLEGEWMDGKLIGTMPTALNDSRNGKAPERDKFGLRINGMEERISKSIQMNSSRRGSRDSRAGSKDIALDTARMRTKENNEVEKVREDKEELVKKSSFGRAEETRDKSKEELLKKSSFGRIDAKSKEELVKKGSFGKSDDTKDKRNSTGLNL